MTLYPDGTTTRPAVSSPFGPREGGAFGFHYGADLVGFSRICAVAPGTVTFAGWLNDSAGNTVVIDHGGGVSSLYMHNASHNVGRGQLVAEGQQVAVMGATGNATGACNHLEIRQHGTSIEPLTYIAAGLTHAAHTTQEDEMTASYINIQGKENERRGGCYAIMRSNDGILFARFASATPLAGVPTVTDERAIKEWRDTMPGIG